MYSTPFNRDQRGRCYITCLMISSDSRVQRPTRCGDIGRCSKRPMSRLGFSTIYGLSPMKQQGSGNPFKSAHLQKEPSLISSSDNLTHCMSRRSRRARVHGTGRTVGLLVQIRRSQELFLERSRLVHHGCHLLSHQSCYFPELATRCSIVVRASPGNRFYFQSVAATVSSPAEGFTRTEVLEAEMSCERNLMRTRHTHGQTRQLFICFI